MTTQMTAAQLDKQASIAYVAEYHNRAAADAAEKRGETNAAHNYAAQTARSAAEGLYYSAAAAARRAAVIVDPANARQQAATARRAAADAAAAAADAQAHADSITGTSMNDLKHSHAAADAAEKAAKAAAAARQLYGDAPEPDADPTPVTVENHAAELIAQLAQPK